MSASRPASRPEPHSHPASPPRPIAVYGATGHTGRFVCAELLRRGRPVVLSGRDAARLDRLAAELGLSDPRPAAIEDAEALQGAFAGAAAVINCAGPFLDTAPAVAAAALRAGAHYLDVTAEQRAAQATMEDFGAAARAQGLALLPAAAFYGGLADLLATAATADWPDIDPLDIAIALDRWHPTEGTRLTGQRNHYPRLHVVRGALAPLPQPAPTRDWAFEAPFGEEAVIELPFSEMITLTRHLRVTEVHSYLNLASLNDLRDPATPPPVAEDGQGRSGQVFRMEVAAQRGGETRRVAANGRDIYAMSAPIVVEAALRLGPPHAGEGGAFALGERFDARELLRALAPHGLDVAL